MNQPERHWLFALLGHALVFFVAAFTSVSTAEVWEARETADFVDGVWEDIACLTPAGVSLDVIDGWYERSELIGDHPGSYVFNLIEFKGYMYATAYAEGDGGYNGFMRWDGERWKPIATGPATETAIWRGRLWVGDPRGLFYSYDGFNWYPSGVGFEKTIHAVGDKMMSLRGGSVSIYDGDNPEWKPVKWTIKASAAYRGKYGFKFGWAGFENIYAYRGDIVLGGGGGAGIWTVDWERETLNLLWILNVFVTSGDQVRDFAHYGRDLVFCEQGEYGSTWASDGFRVRNLSQFDGNSNYLVKTTEGLWVTNGILYQGTGTAMPNPAIAYRWDGRNFKTAAWIRSAHAWWGAAYKGDSYVGTFPSAKVFRIPTIYCNSGTYISSRINAQGTTVTKASLSWQQQLRGGRISYSLSNDGGQTWVPVTRIGRRLAQTVTFPKPGHDLRARAVLESGPAEGDPDFAVRDFVWQEDLPGIGGSERTPGVVSLLKEEGTRELPTPASRIWAVLSDDLQGNLSRHATGFSERGWEKRNAPPERLRRQFVEEMNSNVLGSETLYDADAWKGVHLSSKVRNLHRPNVWKSLDEDAMREANRLLLDDTYPRVIKPRRNASPVLESWRVHYE